MSEIFMIIRLTLYVALAVYCATHHRWIAWSVAMLGISFNTLLFFGAPLLVTEIVRTVVFGGFTYIVWKKK